MADIFGNGDKGGLIHCLSANDFDNALQQLEPSWKEKHRKGAEFLKYFIEKKQLYIKETMTVEIRSLCGLGFPPDVYMQNASKSMNRVLKEDKDQNSTRMAKNSVVDIVKQFWKVVKRQEQEQFLSVIGRGEYAIKQRFKSLEVGERYFRMNEAQKEYVKKILQLLIEQCQF